MARKSQGSPQFPSLLIVQQQPAVARTFGRLLGDAYDEVLLAESPEQAEQLLSASLTKPIHVVCGQYFGQGRPTGQQWLASWRPRFPAIERAVLATGAEGLSTEMSGIDGVYQKPGPLTQLFHLLGVRRTEPSSSLPGSFQPLNKQMELNMKTKSPQAHQVSTLKERLSQSAKQDKQAGHLRTAQGFASA